MKLSYILPALGLVSLLAGCSTSPTKYDQDSSLALTVVTAAGINDRLKDVEVPKDTTWDIRDTAGFNIPAAISVYNTPTPGLSGGQSAGLSLASWLLAPESEASKNHIIAWQPGKGGPSDGALSFAKSIGEAAQMAAKEKGIDTWINYHNQDKAAYLFLSDTSSDKCTNKEYCMIFGFVLTDPEKQSPAPEFVDIDNSAFFYDPRERNSYTFNKAYMGFNEVEFLQLVSKHLPKWVYLYIAPGKLKLDNETNLDAPLIINNGELKYFIKTAK